MPTLTKLKTTYKDDVLNTVRNDKRKYQMVNNTDSTISLVDKTAYTTKGDTFGASDINDTNIVVNSLIDSVNEVEQEASQGGDLALPVETLNEKMKGLENIGLLISDYSKEARISAESFSTEQTTTVNITGLKNSDFDANAFYLVRFGVKADVSLTGDVVHDYRGYITTDFKDLKTAGKNSRAVNTTNGAFISTNSGGMYESFIEEADIIQVPSNNNQLSIDVKVRIPYYIENGVPVTSSIGGIVNMKVTAQIYKIGYDLSKITGGELPDSKITWNNILSKPFTSVDADSFRVVSGELQLVEGSGGGGGDVPIATTSTAGKVKPDGSTITVDSDGTIHGFKYEITSTEPTTIENGKVVFVYE